MFACEACNRSGIIELVSQQFNPSENIDTADLGTDFAAIFRQFLNGRLSFWREHSKWSIT